MNENERFEMLMRRALDGEAMSDDELRDFARCLIDSPGRTREFALLRRIEQDAPEAARMRAPAGLADSVMDAVAHEPIPERAPRMRGLGAAGAIMAAALAAAGAVLVAWGGITRLTDWLPSTDALSDTASEWQAALVSAMECIADPGGVISPWLWVGLAAPALAAAMHVHMLRRESATGRRNR